MAMTFAIKHELKRIAAGLRDSIPPDRYTQFYAAQQALSWALFPEGFMSPYETIACGKVQPVIPDTREGSADYSAALRQIPS